MREIRAVPPAPRPEARSPEPEARLPLRHELQHATLRAVGQEIERSLRPLAHVSDPFPLWLEVGEQPFFVDDALAVDGQPTRFVLAMPPMNRWPFQAGNSEPV